MSAIDRKLMRDFQRLWAQALAIALLLACGVAILLATYGTYISLEETRSAYYERNRFSDIFADANRAPRWLMQDTRQIEGVRAADARISKSAVLDVPGRQDPVTARILSLPRSGNPRLNLPVLRERRLPSPEAHNEVAVNQAFAEANHLQPGDTFLANLNGSRRALTLTGTLFSPEFIYTIGPGALTPDNETFGVLWMPESAVAATFDMEGACNKLVRPGFVHSQESRAPRTRRPDKEPDLRILSRPSAILL